MPSTTDYRWLVKKNGEKVLQKRTHIYEEKGSWVSNWKEAYPTVFEKDLKKEK